MGWEELGTVTVTDEWQTLPHATIGGEVLLRASFLVSSPSLFTKINSYGWLRRTWEGHGAELANKLYPKSELVLFSLPVSSVYFGLGSVENYYQIKKVFYYNKNGWVQDINWSFKLECYVP